MAYNEASSGGEMETTLKTRWSKLETSKTSVLDRARACAELTIPSLLTKQGHKEQDTLKTPYQSLGSRAINHLASKLLLTLLPPIPILYARPPNWHTSKFSLFGGILSTNQLLI